MQTHIDALYIRNYLPTHYTTVYYHTVNMTVTACKLINLKKSMNQPLSLSVRSYCWPAVTKSASVHSSSPIISCLLMSSIFVLSSISTTTNFSFWISSKEYRSRNALLNCGVEIDIKSATPVTDSIRTHFRVEVVIYDLCSANFSPASVHELIEKYAWVALREVV